MKKLSLAMVAGVATLLFASAATAGSVRADGSARSATTLKVCPDADKCFTSIQAAIDAATDGAKIKIAAGTYAGSLVIDKGITLDGTGAGETIISADANKRVITVIADVSVTIRGLTVTGGSLQFIPGLDPPGDPYPDFVGGGIFVASSSSVELLDVAVSANSAFSGGGIYSEGTLKLHKSTVTGNSSNGTGGEAGGIYSEGTLTLKNTIVSDNSVTSGGTAGGIYNSGPALLANSTVRDNTAARGSLGGIGNIGTMTLENVTVSGNDAQTHGGIGNGGTLIVNDSVVSDNVGILGAGGIASDGTLTVTASTISGNSSFLFGGGGILNGGTMTLKGTSISGNESVDLGGGIVNDGTATLDDSTVSANSASCGGGIYNHRGALTLRDTTVSGNTATFTGGGLYNVATVLLFASTISGNTPNDRVDAEPVFPAPCIDNM